MPLYNASFRRLLLIMISIVIPLYNKAQSIANTIKCIQNQTYQDFEIVVVEGW